MTDITANVIVSMPSQLFTMARSFKAVANGKIYIGKIDTDPVNPENQIQVYVENEDGSHVPVSQPIIINAAGYPVYNGQIAKFVTVKAHSMAVYDAYGARQFYFGNIIQYDAKQILAILSGDIGATFVGWRKRKLNDILDSISIRSDDFLTLHDWAAYPAKHKILAGGNYNLSSRLEIDCETLSVEGVANINVGDSFVAMYFGTNQRDLLTTISSNISKGITSLTVDNVQEGDTLCFYNPSDFSWSGHRNYYRGGEFVKVVRYSNGIAYFNGGTKAAYPSGTQVYKLKTKKVSVNGTFVFNFPSYHKNAMAMQFEQVADGNFDNLVVTSHTAPYAVQFKRCFNLAGKGMRITQESPSVSFGLEYACYICNSQNIDFEGIFCAERHSVTVTGNDEICGIVNRFISVNASGGAILTVCLPLSALAVTPLRFMVCAATEPLFLISINTLAGESITAPERFSVPGSTVLVPNAVELPPKSIQPLLTEDGSPIPVTWILLKSNSIDLSSVASMLGHAGVFGMWSI
ncbi:phage head-binding domain-containing protein [Escherichia coli]|uniref:phage head-binding domain-containing protein n=1 Tax=Escherichia coli TaxID=562 RepID=UPI0007507EA9|nr:phage head-binding domain-containing protein [Escherichia coli]KUU01428.1 hypothetical protein AWF12_01740 [Escherichia coli]